jgi:ribonuclease P protein component
VSSIKKRRDFLALRQGERASCPGFLLLARKNPENGENVRFGLTVTKKLGGAVVRNRIRRRLRAAANVIFPEYSRPGGDYVLIARAAAYDRNYAALLDDMKHALLSLRGDTK